MTHNQQHHLDPENWGDFRELAHEMLDDMLTHMQTYRERPTWQAIPKEIKEHLRQPLPKTTQTEAEVYQEFVENILPYSVGNAHPRFWGWVVGTGTPLAMLAEMLANGYNNQMGGGESAGLYVELQVLDWLKELFDFPQEASGLLVSGASMANFVGLSVARNAHADFDVRHQGMQSEHPRMILYTSTEVHSCHQKNAELLGIGNASIRFIPVNDEYQINIDLLQIAIREDRANGHQPFCVIGTAGTVKTGAFDDIQALADICEQENLWLHVDGAFGAFAKIVPEYAHLVKGMERADSLGFDMHKWISLPFEVACVLVRHPDEHYRTFTLTPDYLTHSTRGTAGASTWLSDYGIQLSRSFRALKVWMSIKTHGIEQYTNVIRQNCEQTQYLAQLVDESPELERTASVPLNIVCFRYIAPDKTEAELNALNGELLLRLQESGVAVVSNSTMNGKYSLRMAHVNHRSTYEDFDLLLTTVLQLGRELVSENIVV